jgi:hypothetical protein
MCAQPSASEANQMPLPPSIHPASAKDGPSTQVVSLSTSTALSAPESALTV